MTDRCVVRGCRRKVDLIYLGHGICTYHWDRLAAEGQPAEMLRMVLGIETTTPTAKEAPMSETTSAADTAATEGTMAEKKTKKKTERKQAKPAKAKKEKAPKKEPPPKEDLVVFAFRLTEAERNAIHKTAGPARASQFIRRVAAAFAKADEAGFRRVLEEAGEARR